MIKKNTGPTAIHLPEIWNTGSIAASQIMHVYVHND